MGCCRLGPQASASPLRPPRLRPPLGRGRSYRASRGGDYEAELEHKDDIAAARKESMQLSRMGELKGALKALQNVEPWLVHTYLLTYLRTHLLTYLLPYMPTY